MSKVKHVNKAYIHRDVDALNKLVDSVVETNDLLEQLESKSISEFEKEINKKSGFVNSLMSATAYGKDAEYKRLLELEKLIKGKLSIEDLNAEKEIKSTLLDAIKEKHTTYYSTQEMKTKTILEKAMKEVNALSSLDRQQLAFNQSYELAYNPFSTLRH